MPIEYQISFEKPETLNAVDKKYLYLLLTQKLPAQKGKPIKFTGADGTTITSVPLMVPETMGKFQLRKYHPEDKNSYSIKNSKRQTVNIFLKNTIYLNITEGENGQQHPVYRIIKNKNEPGRVIGKGGFGAVKASDYAIYLDEANESVIIKYEPYVEKKQTLNSDKETEDAFRERITTEYAYAKQHDVPVDQPVFVKSRLKKEGAGREKQTLVAYMHMQRKPGISLDAALKKTSKEGGLSDLPLAKRMGLIAKIADKVHSMHDGSCVHHDIKPANIIYDAKNQQAEFVDFGAVATIGQKGEYFPFTLDYAGNEILTEHEVGVSEKFDILSLAPTAALIVGANNRDLFRNKYNASSQVERLVESYSFEAIPTIEIRGEKGQLVNLSLELRDYLTRMAGDDPKKRPSAQDIARKFREFEAKIISSELKGKLVTLKMKVNDSLIRCNKQLDEIKRDNKSLAMEQILRQLGDALNKSLRQINLLENQPLVQENEYQAVDRAIAIAFSNAVGRNLEALKIKLNSAKTLLEEDIKIRVAEKELSKHAPGEKKSKKALLQQMSSELQEQITATNTLLSKNHINIGEYNQHYKNIIQIFKNDDREEALGKNLNIFKKLLHGIVRIFSVGLYDSFSNERYNFFTPKSQKTAHRAEDEVKEVADYSAIGPT